MKFQTLRPRNWWAFASLSLLFVFQACQKSEVNNTSSQLDNTLSVVKPTTTATTKSGPISIAYVEVNNNSILNVGKYTLGSSTGPNVFDIAIIFAANINYNGTSAYLYNNPQVSNVLKNAATQIKPLQNKGIKVMLSVLGNHQGAGFCNFTSASAANAFAKQIADTVNYYGLDGIDFDDEYADYGTNSTPQPNDSSFVLLASAVRNLLPNKIISFYFIGSATSSSAQAYKGTTLGSLINYSWNPYYGTWSIPSVQGLTNKAQLSPAAVDIQSTSSSTAASLATKTVNGGYGVYLTYNLSATDAHTYISSFTKILYGSSAVYNP